MKTTCTKCGLTFPDEKSAKKHAEYSNLCGLLQFADEVRKAEREVLPPNAWPGKEIMNTVVRLVGGISVGFFAIISVLLFGLFVRMTMATPLCCLTFFESSVMGVLSMGVFLLALGCGCVSIVIACRMGELK